MELAVPDRPSSANPLYKLQTPRPHTAPSHSIDIMTNKTDSGRFPFPVVSIEIFFVNYYLERDAPDLPSSAPLPLHEFTCTAHSCGINSITSNRSRLIDQSSGEFFMFLFAQLFCRKFLYLTRHLLPLPLTMNYNPHSQGPSLRNQSNSQEKKQLH